LAAIYFTAMYVFHSHLNGQPPQQQHDPPPLRRWDAGGADVHHVPPPPRHRRDQFPVDRQAVFDNIRLVDQQQKGDTQVVRDAADKVLLTQRVPITQPPSSAFDVNVPASCNASDSDRHRRSGEFIPIAGLYLLSAFWDQRPNDFDNRHNGTYIRLMAVVHTGVWNEKLVCDFGPRQTAVAFYEMCENHRKPYGGFIISCRVPDDVVEAPCFVTVTAGDHSVEVPVRTLRPRSYSHSFTVCVPPLFGDIHPARLVEFFEVMIPTRSMPKIFLVLLQILVFIVIII